MKIPLADLKDQYSSIRDEIDAAIQRVLQEGQFILGSEVQAFEQEIASYLGVKHAVGVASGTDALQLALLACGVGPGAEVITTPFTFIATAEAITQCGATPVFIDIDPKTYNLDPAKLEEVLEKKFSHQSPITNDQSPMAIHHLLVHTGQHYDYEMSKVFFEDLELSEPDIHLGGRSTGCLPITPPTCFSRPPRPPSKTCGRKVFPKSETTWWAM